MDTRFEYLRLLIDGRITTVDIATTRQADGMIWDTFPVDDRGREGDAASSDHELAPLFAQFDLEDQALALGGAAPPLEVMLGRVEALLR
jgi:hypothetical protein